MKKILALTALCLSLQASAQLVARMEVKEPIPGICNDKEVYGLYSGFTGQVEPACPLTKEQIFERLNNEVRFLKDHPTFKGKGMMGLLINCKGEVVRCRMDNKTGEAELDAQIEAVFNALGTWKSGKLNGKDVDSSYLFSFKIKGGKIMKG